MGVWDYLERAGNAVADGAGAVYDAGSNVVNSAGTAIADGASYVADGAVSLGNAAYHAATDWHFEGRAAHNGPPPSESELPTEVGGPNEQGWQLLPEWMSVYHDDGQGAHERKYINADGRESVRDGDTGAEVTDPNYMATYNYVNPMSWENAHGATGVAEFGARNVGHFVADVIPYWIGGNVRGDG